MPIQITPDTLPDHHFLFIAPNLSADWLFDAARLYWERFSPTVISSSDLIKLVPENETIVISLLTRRDAFRSLAVQVAQAREDAYLDTLVHETAAEAKLSLDNRAETNQPFGVPLAPTPVPPTRVPLQPTPGAILGDGPPSGLPTATPNQSGFVTQVPTSPPGFITQTPTPSPAPDDDNDDTPLDPTPGSIIGG